MQSRWTYQLPTSPLPLASLHTLSLPPHPTPPLSTLLPRSTSLVPTLDAKQGHSRAERMSRGGGMRMYRVRGLCCLRGGGNTRERVVVAGGGVCPGGVVSVGGLVGGLVGGIVTVVRGVAGRRTAVGVLRPGGLCRDGDCLRTRGGRPAGLMSTGLRSERTPLRGGSGKLSVSIRVLSLITLTSGMIVAQIPMGFLRAVRIRYIQSRRLSVQHYVVARTVLLIVKNTRVLEGSPILDVRPFDFDWLRSMRLNLLPTA